MSDLLELVDREIEDRELIPDILPVDARLSVTGAAATLIRLFEKAIAIVPVKPEIPNTEFVLLETFDATTLQVPYTQITATDGYRTVAALDDTLQINMIGAVLLPGKKVLEILKLAPTPNVQLTVLGNTATIRSGRAVWTIQTPTGDSLPPFPDTSDITLHSVARKPFLRALEVARKAVATSTARLSLMQAHVAKGRITACDSARLHRVVIENLPEELDFTLPVKFLDDCIRSLRAFDDDYFELGANGNTVVLRLGQDILTGQRLLLEYPNVETLALQPAMLNMERLIVDVPELIDVVKRVRVSADPDFAALYLSIRPQKVERETKWTLTVRARDKDRNTSQESLDIKYEGGNKAREITVNHKHFLDLLDSLESTLVEFKLGEKTAPILVVDGDFTGVVNPMILTIR